MHENGLQVELILFTAVSVSLHPEIRRQPLRLAGTLAMRYKKRCLAMMTYERTSHGNKGAGSQPSNKGPADYFTGTVRIDPLFDVIEPGRVAEAGVTFEPWERIDEQYRTRE